MTILVTGSAGFIGSALTLELLSRGHNVIGIDNHNDYYSTDIKENRLNQFINHKNYRHFRIDISNRNEIATFFSTYRPSQVVNLAAQAGVRYSIENPSAYIDSNILGFANILEGCRCNDVSHLVYASSSSVYGANIIQPFSEDHNVDHPISLYAATKKSNELMAHSYSHLYGLPTTGLRFFTVYGPWGRPDMALFKFTRAILSNEPIQIFNLGNSYRDFTYIDDVVNSILLVLNEIPMRSDSIQKTNLNPSSSLAPWNVYNVGNQNPVILKDFILAIERALGKEAKKVFLEAQPGDLNHTSADMTLFSNKFGYLPNTLVQEGVNKFISWYLNYYKNA